MKTSKGYLIYLDVLGYRNILNSKNNNEIKKLQNLIDSIDKRSLRNKANLIIGNTKIKFRSYSDNFLIFYKSKTVKLDELAAIVYYASNILGTAINYGFMMRGSIVYGELSSNRYSVFGKDIITAYDLESSHNQPCVVLDNFLKHKYEEYELYKEELLSPFSTFHKNDTQSALLFANGIEIMVDRLNSQSIVDDKTLEKHRWLINEFNRYFDGCCEIAFIEAPSHYEIEVSTDVNHDILMTHK